jgi:hypothetical protein
MHQRPLFYEIFHPLSTRLPLLDPDFKDSIVHADIVVGVGTKDPEYKALFYGRRTMERIAARDESRDVSWLDVPIDFDTDDVEALVAACKKWKGSSCYNHGHQPPNIAPEFN